MKREEAIAVMKELLDGCIGLDGRSLELTSPNATASTESGYQIIIRGTLDEETKKHIQGIAAARQLSLQIGSIWRTKRSINKSEPDTLIIYRAKKLK